MADALVVGDGGVAEEGAGVGGVVVGAAACSRQRKSEWVIEHCEAILCDAIELWWWVRAARADRLERDGDAGDEAAVEAVAAHDAHATCGVCGAGENCSGTHLLLRTRRVCPYRRAAGSRCAGGGRGWASAAAVSRKRWRVGELSATAAVLVARS